MSRVVALVPAAGLGVRLAAGLPKAFVELRGEPLLRHAVRGLAASGRVHRVVVAVAPDQRDRARAALVGLDGAVDLVDGGAERTDSVRSALAGAPDADVVLVHDAARCLTPPGVVSAVIDAVVGGCPAVVPVLPVADTVKQVDGAGRVVATPDRAALRVVQTPQGFDAAVLRRAYAEPGLPATDDAGLVERLGVPVATVPGDPHAFKITTPFDLAVAAALLP